ncbi:MAG: hypothetical protein EHM93_17545 [Bacteroidales bacterium]|nr:MAG: hypothetical protein EHM93_17545 [Bacteroidales bacterium]
MKTSNNTLMYIIVIAVIIIAFLLLGGSQWMNGMMHRGRPMIIANWNWTQILISVGIGFLLGWFVARRR